MLVALVFLLGLLRGPFLHDVDALLVDCVTRPLFCFKLTSLLLTLLSLP